jgi:hypothetical protein
VLEHRTALDIPRRDTSFAKILYHLREQLASVFSWAVIFVPIFKEDDAMKIEKLPSGSYRIRKTYKGQTYTVVFESKPTQKEAMQAMAKEMDKVQEKHISLTFQAAAIEYIGAKRNILSPTTIRAYNSAMKTISKKFQVLIVK